MNQLYPVFFKLEKLQLLIVGAGAVGYEKLSFILKSSPNAQVTILAEWVSPEVYQLIQQYSKQIILWKKSFEPNDVEGFDLIIAATNLKAINHEVHAAAKLYRILINVADTPDLCDFYLGSIVTKGDLKIAISTNAKSPTFAKRFRQLLEEALPENIQDTLDLLQEFRSRLTNDFEAKVEQLNLLTSGLLESSNNIK